MTPAAARTALVWLLRLGGALLLLAGFAIVMPSSWMAAGHRWLGLGEFPASALVEYLTRSISGLYAFHGGVLWLASSDLRRFRPLVFYLATMNVVFGLIMLGIDLRAGLPAWWVLGEGPPLAVTGTLMLVLARIGLREPPVAGCELPPDVGRADRVQRQHHHAEDDQTDRYSYQ